MAHEKPKKDIEDLSAEEALELMKSGEKVKLAPPPKRDNMTLFTLRLDYDTIDELAKTALEEDSKPSTVARQLIHEALERRRYDESIAPDFSSDIAFILSKYKNLYYHQLNPSPFITPYLESLASTFTVEISTTQTCGEVK
ncbi:MAG: hypothetical protein MUP40_06385 [Actinobacteria bacterium]|nr:hypothetical protein [Actinomycetota bacterium]